MSNTIFSYESDLSNPSILNTQLTARVKNKFEQGFLGGVGSTSQFQGANQLVGVFPDTAVNNDLEQRVESSLGHGAGPHLQPGWERNMAFAPGLGVDAYRSKITWTDESTIDPTSGIIRPLVQSGIDRPDAGPIAALRTYQYGDANSQAPYVATGGEAAVTITDRIKETQSQFDKRTKKNKKGGARK